MKSKLQDCQLLTCTLLTVIEIIIGGAGMCWDLPQALRPVSHLSPPPQGMGASGLRKMTTLPSYAYDPDQPAPAYSNDPDKAWSILRLKVEVREVKPLDPASPKPEGHTRFVCISGPVPIPCFLHSSLIPRFHTALWV